MLDKSLKSNETAGENYKTIFFSIIGNFIRNENKLVYDSAMVGVISLLSWKNTNF